MLTHMKQTPAFLFVLAALACAGSAAVAQMPAPPHPPGHNPPPGQRPPVRPMPPAPRPGVAGYGDPLPGLTPDELALFTAGRIEFQNTETPESGLGPIFNNVSCVACHSSRAVGGAGAITVTRFGRMLNGQFDGFPDAGGSLLQEHAIDPAVQEVIPPEATIIAQRQTTPLYGAGLMEAIADEDLLRLAARTVGDGIHGRAALITDVTTGAQRVGRFGWKDQHATLLGFAADAYLNEMGITNRFFPLENAPNGNRALLAQFDLTSDPEDTVNPATNKSDIDAAADFMRLLAPPPALPLTTAAALGKATFTRINCIGCHVASFTTGASPVAALSHQPVRLYSDLLLHDMGKLGDGIAQSAAGQREMRTAPLWGLRASSPYLHDGRAMTIDEAIRAHEGEAALSRDRYLRLSPAQKQQLIAFLNSI